MTLTVSAWMLALTVRQAETLSIPYLAYDMKMAPGKSPVDGTVDLILSTGHSLFQLIGTNSTQAYHTFIFLVQTVQSTVYWVTLSILRDISALF